jgi:hypothetical protein
MEPCTHTDKVICQACHDEQITALEQTILSQQTQLTIARTNASFLQEVVDSLREKKQSSSEADEKIA